MVGIDHFIKNDCSKNACLQKICGYKKIMYKNLFCDQLFRNRTHSSKILPCKFKRINYSNIYKLKLLPDSSLDTQFFFTGNEYILFNKFSNNQKLPKKCIRLGGFIYIILTHSVRNVQTYNFDYV